MVGADMRDCAACDSLCMQVHVQQAQVCFEVCTQPAYACTACVYCARESPQHDACMLALHHQGVGMVVVDAVDTPTTHVPHLLTHLLNEVVAEGCKLEVREHSQWGHGRKAVVLQVDVGQGRHCTEGAD